MSDKNKIETAIQMALDYGQSDGAHHKAWAIDQMLRILTGCTKVEVEKTLVCGKRYTSMDYNESPEYKTFINKYKEDYGYDWDKGIP